MATHTWSLGRSIFFTGMALAAAVLVNQVVGCMSAPAQQPSRAFVAVNPLEASGPTVDGLIRQMSQSAGILFVGEVLDVRRPAGFAGSAQDAAEGLVEVDFRVEQAVRGVSPNSIYTLREWAGLWAGATDRYRVGQHVFMMLRSPDAAGFTSPVHGAEGAIPLRGQGAAPGPYDSVSRPAAWMVDVRWLRAQVLPPDVFIAKSGRPLPIRWGGRPHPEAIKAASDQATPSFIRVLPGPWVAQISSQPDVESLSHVLALCGIDPETNDAAR